MVSATYLMFSVMTLTYFLTFREDVVSCLTMEVDSYRQALDAAREKMSRLLRDKEAIDSEISMLVKVIDSLAIYCEGVPAGPTFPEDSEACAENLRQAIRMVFKAAAPRSLSPTQVRDKLRESGFNLDRYANELPPIHNTILRLKNNGELEEDIPTRDGRVYKWVSGLKRLLSEVYENNPGRPPARPLSLRSRMDSKKE